jgi:hypothetical protein
LRAPASPSTTARHLTLLAIPHARPAADAAVLPGAAPPVRPFARPGPPPPPGTAPRAPISGHACPPDCSWHRLDESTTDEATYSFFDLLGFAPQNVGLGL